MIVIRSPLRVSLFGGGCDLPEYFTEYGATIISLALSCSIFLIHNPRPTGNYRVSYSEVEELDNLMKSKHTLIRVAEHEFGLGSPSTLSIISDVPKGTGLGSSSSLAVALTYLAMGESLHPDELVQRAYELERQVSPMGFQDHLPAAFGGLKIYEMSKGSKLTVHDAPPELESIIQNFGMLLYTGIDRKANGILHRMKKKLPLDELSEIQHVAEYVCRKLRFSPWWATPTNIAGELTYSWQCKSNIPGVTSAKLDKQFTTALYAGALGGKLCGAGGGGCWFLIVPPGRRDDVVKATGLVEIPFSIGERISEVVI